MEPHYLECQCSSEEHTIRLAIDEEDGHIYTSVFLNDWERWYKRLWKAIKYLFGYKCKYGHFDCTMLRPEDYDRIRNLLTLSEERNKVYMDKIYHDLGTKQEP